MARYLVLEKSFINNGIVEQGAEVEFDGVAAGNLSLIGGDVDAPAKLVEANTKSAKRQKKSADAGSDSDQIDAESLQRQQAAAETGEPSNGDSLA